MLRRFLLFFFLMFCTGLYAQTDTLPVAAGSDTLQPAIISDSTTITTTPKPALSWQQDTAFTRFFVPKNQPAGTRPVFAINSLRQPVQQDQSFYILVGLLLFTGIIRAAFPKYFTTLFQLFFQSSQRQRQSKESISQDALPSFLLNINFILSAGLLLAVFVRGNDFLSGMPFLLLWLYACTALAVVYIIKSLFISFLGWAFAAQEPAANYRFIVFLVNKVAGLSFIPLLLLLMYATGTDFTVLSTIAVAFIVILLIYRYIVSLSVVGKKLKVNPVHFFLYLCAVEVLPLLITYKVLLLTKAL